MAITKSLTWRKKKYKQINKSNINDNSIINNNTRNITQTILEPEFKIEKFYYLN